jgi:hypothetical protein
MPLLLLVLLHCLHHAAVFLSIDVDGRVICLDTPSKLLLVC